MSGFFLHKSLIWTDFLLSGVLRTLKSSIHSIQYHQVANQPITCREITIDNGIKVFYFCFYRPLVFKFSLSAPGVKHAPN